MDLNKKWKSRLPAHTSIEPDVDAPEVPKCDMELCPDETTGKYTSGIPTIPVKCNGNNEHWLN